MKRTTAGFSILEAMIALLVLSVTASGVFQVLTDSVRRAAQHEARTFAAWVAANDLNACVLKLDKPAEQEEITVSMAGRRWRVFRQTEAVEGSSGFVKLRVRALEQSALPTASVTLETLALR